MFIATSTWATSPLDPCSCASVENKNYAKQQLILFLPGYQCTTSPKQVTAKTD